ncbi:hypothetical protein LINGRAHAP2_LOCUS10172 [Linum grandiflorum]
MNPISSSIITTSYVVQFSQDDIGDDRIRLDLSLIGRIFWPADPKPSMSVLHALARQWRIPPEDLQIFDVGHCLTQFVFPTIKDKERIFQSQPWAFKSSIINLMEWETPSQMVFDRLQFMPLVIQMKEIPYPYSTVKFCTKPVEPLGTVLSADIFSKYPDGHGSRFIKCTVRINLLQSLAGRIRAVVPNQQPFWVLLRYEDLPTVCFICGMLGHGYKHCAYAEVLPFNREERGDWMLARPEGHKIKTPNFSETATSKQKGRSQKPVSSFFHTYIQASPEASSSAMQVGNLSISAPPLRTISEGPICDGNLTSFSRSFPFCCSLSSDLSSVIIRFFVASFNSDMFNPVLSPILPLRYYNLFWLSSLPTSGGSGFYCRVPAFLPELSSDVLVNDSLVIFSELQEMDIEDRKRPRDLTLEPDYGSSKKLKIADIPLLESDFPEGVLDLEPLSSDDVDEFAAELAAELEPVSTEVTPGVIPHPTPMSTVSMSTEVVKAARPKRPRKPK